MRKTIFIIPLILLGLFSCQNKKTEKIKNLKSEKIVKKADPVFSQKDYALVYEYSNGESNQLLGINIMDTERIKFHLVTKTLPCDTEYWGVATNKYADLASEVDEDENGTAYGANEYAKIEKEYIIAIRLALDSSKVKINYVEEDAVGTDCLPITAVIMKRIK